LHGYVDWINEAGMFCNVIELFWKLYFLVLVESCYLHWTTTFEISFTGSLNHGSFINIVEYYLHWTTTVWDIFSGSSDTNHDSLL
jgi:hypothetical protein